MAGYLPYTFARLLLFLCFTVSQVHFKIEEPYILCVCVWGGCCACKECQVNRGGGAINLGTEHVWVPKQFLEQVQLQVRRWDILAKIWGKKRCIFVCFLFFLREKERECEKGRGREREGERKSQADSAVQSPMCALHSWTTRSWPEPKLDT